MSEATETTQEEAQLSASEQPAARPEKGHSVLAQAAGIGMAMLGSSTAGDVVAGNTMPHADHGHSVSRWVAVLLSMTGWVVGGVLFPFAMLPAGIVCGACQLLALIALPVLNAAGYGRRDIWGELKAEAAAERAAA